MELNLGTMANVSRGTSLKLEQYLSLLKKWNTVINLVSPKTLDDAVKRHFLDSAQLVDLMPEDAGTLVDLGSGGGFPGLVIAILSAETRPNLKVTLVESDQRKASFLRTVLRETEISGTVLSKRIMDVEPLQADILTARALAPLLELCQFADHHLMSTGVALFPKGKNWGKEVEDARAEWQFRYTAHTSKTDADAVVLEIRDLAHD
ncbi:16S rRNA (guanine(527)-N(7))-methyltransferase RsmG [Sagittula stellata]|uniref:Ribosomal RNA small subunit methyltransferase G n=1 Tax=Sagittula stellata (strain ATCC 700073 / DSM 11524 / E-37) TaxID=388399 RepID=A3K2X7_SAGS3|nr:16S rRNA (guanine(527)-N(7))-methyltransferase RsmG [Sagittula stellata]EBA08536.1 glucose-inhibited division protein B [Sagittula stellata E-37]